MRHNALAGIMASLALAGSLVACGAQGGTLSNDIDDETGAVTFTADRASGSAIGGATVTLEEGQLLLVSPNMESGALTLRVSDGVIGEDAKMNVIVNESFDGKAIRTYDLGPSEYTLGVTAPDGATATGTLVVSAVDADEYEAQNEQLSDALSAATEGVKATDTTKE